MFASYTNIWNKNVCLQKRYLYQFEFPSRWSTSRLAHPPAGLKIIIHKDAYNHMVFVSLYFVFGSLCSVFGTMYLVYVSLYLVFGVCIWYLYWVVCSLYLGMCIWYLGVYNVYIFTCGILKFVFGIIRANATCKRRAWQEDFAVQIFLQQI